MSKDTRRQISLSLKPDYLESLEELENCFVLRLKGRVDMNAIAAGKPVMDEIIKKHNLFEKNIVVNAAEVTEADTASIAAMIKRLSEIRHTGKKLIFCNMPGLVRSIVSIAKLESVIETYDSEESALKELS